ncbi:hypothetical protein [Viridibacillus arvi]|uniref:hypothetical protein n=1 Tax=Viridibacillus arvi TaxID=263475 RepID=UPI003D2A1BDB
MDNVKQVEKEIREEWFANHVVEISGEEGMQVISWGQPGTNIYRTKYVLSGSNIFISGDIGETVYCLTCRATLKNIEDFDFHYFTGKLSAFCEARWNFDEKLAKKELKEYWKEYEMKRRYKDSQEIYDGIISAIDESSSLEAYRAWLMPVYQDTSIESDDLESIWEIGKRMPYRLIGYWVGLQMVVEQLKKTEVAVWPQVWQTTEKRWLVNERSLGVETGYL